MSKFDTSYQAYENYMANMIFQNQENILEYNDWVNRMNEPTPEEFQSTTEEISLEEAENLGVVWATDEEIKALGLNDDE